MDWEDHPSIILEFQMTFFLNTYCEPDFSRMILYRLSHVIQITFNPLRPDFIVITL